MSETILERPRRHEVHTFMTTGLEAPAANDFAKFRRLMTLLMCLFLWRG